MPNANDWMKQALVNRKEQGRQRIEQLRKPQEQPRQAKAPDWLRQELNRRFAPAPAETSEDDSTDDAA